jgi:hypothetical protein
MNGDGNTYTHAWVYKIYNLTIVLMLWADVLDVCRDDVLDVCQLCIIFMGSIIQFELYVWIVPVYWWDKYKASHMQIHKGLT